MRLFFAEARRRKLIVGEDAKEALAWLCELTKCLPKAAGKTSIEALKEVLAAQTSDRFSREILPALRKK